MGAGGCPGSGVRCGTGVVEVAGPLRVPLEMGLRAEQPPAACAPPSSPNKGPRSIGVVW